MSYIQGADRAQTQLLPPSVEEYVDANAPVRAIDAFVAGLDLAGMGLGGAPAATGRPAYDPADLLKLYLYGYLYRIRSSRRLEAETHRNLELIWLLRGLRPDFWTIAAFRREHRRRFKLVFREFNLLCRKMELFGAELVAIDGAKFKGVNSPRRNYTDAQLTELMAQVDARIEAYLTQLDAVDQEQEGAADRPSAEELAAKLEQLRERRTYYEALNEQLRTNEAKEVSLTDPDSRGQKKVGVGYNAQFAVDAKHDLIVEAEVVQDQNDLKQLHPMAVAAQASLQADVAAVADAGYHSADQFEKCEASGVETYVPAPRGTAGVAPGGNTVYPKTDFTYDAERDCYRCPNGQDLRFGYTADDQGNVRRYYYNIPACGACALKGNCTTAKYRKLSRRENEAAVERQAQRVAAHPEIVAARKTIVEHVIGWFRLGQHDQFLCRGLEMVRAEFCLSAFAYNLRRVLNIVGTAGLLAALRPAA